MQIALIGYRATGKSAVGRRVAEMLRLPFMDLDDAIEERTGKTIRQIFLDVGEQGFRKLESSMLCAVRTPSDLVLSVGGGAVLRAENRNRIRQSEWVVYLCAEPETILQRWMADPTTMDRRPKLTDADLAEEVKTTMAAREPWYIELADVIIDTDPLSVDEVAARIVAFVRSGKPHKEIER